MLMFFFSNNPFLLISIFRQISYESTKKKEIILQKHKTFHHPNEYVDFFSIFHFQCNFQNNNYNKFSYRLKVHEHFIYLRHYFMNIDINVEMYEKI